MATMEALNAVFCRVFNDNRIVISPETTANDIDGWDSLSHVTLILAVEKEFKVRFSQKELLMLSNVGDLHRIIESKLPK